MRVTKLPVAPTPVLKVLIVLVLVMTMSACSWLHHKGDPLDTMPLAQLYGKAHNDLEHADYSAAEKAYQRLIARFPSGPFNQQAQLELTVLINARECTRARARLPPNPGLPLDLDRIFIKARALAARGLCLFCLHRLLQDLFILLSTKV